jgi:hypothetical protein
VLEKHDFRDKNRNRIRDDYKAAGPKPRRFFAALQKHGLFGWDRLMQSAFPLLQGLANVR